MDLSKLNPHCTNPDWTWMCEHALIELGSAPVS